MRKTFRPAKPKHSTHPESTSSPEASAPESDREFVRSLAKGLAVIEAFDADFPSMTLSEVTRRTGLSPGSARRVLITLDRLGYVATRNQQFRLQPRALRLGYAYLSSLGLASMVQPLLVTLTQEVDECCSLAILDGLEVVYLARVPAKRLMRDYMAVGTRFPAHLTSVGKVLLADAASEVLDDYLERARFEAITPFSITTGKKLRASLRTVAAQRWAVNDQEVVLGLRSIAVPVAVEGRTIAALGASTDVARTTVEEMTATLVPALQRAAASLSDLLIKAEWRQQWL